MAAPISTLRTVASLVGRLPLCLSPTASIQYSRSQPYVNKLHHQHSSCFLSFNYLRRTYSSLSAMAEVAKVDPVIPEEPLIQAETSEAKTEELKTTNGNSAEQVPVASTEQEKKARIRRRKHIMLLSYCGQEYMGMQWNPQVKTIEAELFEALRKADYMTEEECIKPQLVQFQRSSRTDKHVSAARQIVSLKIDENLDIEKINEQLPACIRVMGSKRVTQGFDSKKSCDARTYMYMTPTFAFCPLEVPVTEDYRITPEVLEKIRETLKVYIGTKNYHNFTSRKRPNDPSAVRVMKTFTCSEPFMQDGLEYVILRVKGQSFMMHQIRKMIGLVMAHVRGFASADVFVKCWQQDRIDIPRAPGLGLMLDYVHYDRYDQKFGSDGMHDPLTWDSLEDKIKQFCDEYIYPVVTRCENEEKSMFTWLETLVFHTYDVRDDTNISNSSRIGKAYYKLLREQGRELTPAMKKILEEADDSDDEDVLEAKRAKIE